MLRRAHMNGKSATFSTPAPFALSLSKGKRGVFQHPVRKAGSEFGRSEGEQSNDPCPLYRSSKVTLVPSTGPGNSTGNNLSPISDKLGQKPSVLIIVLQLFVGTKPANLLAAEHGPASAKRIIISIFSLWSISSSHFYLSKTPCGPDPASVISVPDPPPASWELSLDARVEGSSNSSSRRTVRNRNMPSFSFI